VIAESYKRAHFYIVNLVHTQLKHHTMNTQTITGRAPFYRRLRQFLNTGNTRNTLGLVICLLMLSTVRSYSQQHDHTHLHVGTKYKDCSFQIDSALTQNDWEQFTREAGLVAYYRPLVDAKPLGKWNFEFSILQWKTKIDDSDNAWNNTFVHPDSTHWLTEGPRLTIPGLAGRVGITNKLDVGVYFSKNFQSNYGVWGAQVQYNLVNDTTKKWSASARATCSAIFGPEDLKVNIYGIDLLASKDFRVYRDWAYLSPYAGVSSYLSCSHETTSKVDLKDEKLLGGQGMIGVVAKLSIARIGVEYNFAKRSTLSFKLGIAF
jgi:hypothetical protein